jgi:hypothetical protein
VHGAQWDGAQWDGAQWDGAQWDGAPPAANAAWAQHVRGARRGAVAIRGWPKNVTMCPVSRPPLLGAGSGLATVSPPREGRIEINRSRALRPSQRAILREVLNPDRL